MEQRLLDDDLLDQVDLGSNLTNDDDDIWSQQSEEDEMKSWEIGFGIGEEAASSDVVRHWNDDDY